MDYGQSSAGGQSTVPESNHPITSGQAGTTVQPVSSGSAETGDIVLQTAESSGQRKRWVVVLAIIAAAILLGVIVWLVFGSAFGNNASVSMKNSFNRFANYVVSGVEDDKDISTEYDPSEGYYFLTHQTTSEEQAELYNNTGVLLNNFMKDYRAGRGNIEETDLLGAAVNDESQLMNFMSIVYTKQLPTRSYIEDTYLESGSAAALQELLRYYDFSQVDGNSYAEEFSVDYENWVSAQIANFDIYRDNDCLVDGTASLYCIRQKGDADLNETLSASNDAIKEARATLSGYFGFSNSFVANAFVINDLLNGAAGNSNTMTGGNGE